MQKIDKNIRLNVEFICLAPLYEFVVTWSPCYRLWPVFVE